MLLIIYYFELLCIWLMQSLIDSFIEKNIAQNVGQGLF